MFSQQILNIFLNFNNIILIYSMEYVKYSKNTHIILILYTYYYNKNL